jgi:16S rRNA (uracil1498-N3)-methyltransferase
MDWTIEKAVELGAVAIAPLGCARSQVRLDPARAVRRLEHWRHIVEAACTQSGRSLLPRIAPIAALGAFLATAREQGAGTGPACRLLVLDPRASRPLSQAGVARDSAVVLLAGPESGLAEDDLREACEAGFEAVAVGPRTLRTETAGLAAIAALQALAGDF